MLYPSPHIGILSWPLLLFLMPQAWVYCDQYGKFRALESSLKIVAESFRELVSSDHQKRCSLEGEKVEIVSQVPGKTMVLISSFIFLSKPWLFLSKVASSRISFIAIIVASPIFVCLLIYLVQLFDFLQQILALIDMHMGEFIEMLLSVLKAIASPESKHKIGSNWDGPEDESGLYKRKHLRRDDLTAKKRAPAVFHPFLLPAGI